jgi:hypothetical protein
VLAAAAPDRIIAISGTIPDPPAMSRIAHRTAETSCRLEGG